MSVDILIFHQLNGFALKNLWFDATVIFLAKYLPYVLGGGLFLFLLGNFKKYWKMVAGAMLTGGLSFVLVKTIRFFWLRPRPFVENPVNLLLPHSSTGAFPSAHAAIFFAISTALFLYNKKAGIVFFIASFLIGLSRVFCGLHWPGDILAGMGVGILCALLIHKFNFL